MNIFIGMTRYALPVFAFIILVKCVLTLLLGHPVNKVYAYIIDSSSGEKIPLNMWETSIGKGKSCDIQLGYDSIAPSQAVISRRADGWYIFDTESKVGTCVNGTKVEKRTLIKHGDKLKFADRTFVFAVADDPVIAVGKGRKSKRGQQTQQGIPTGENPHAPTRSAAETPFQRTTAASAARPVNGASGQKTGNKPAEDFSNENFNLNFRGKTQNESEKPSGSMESDTLHSGHKIYSEKAGASDNMFSDAGNGQRTVRKSYEPAVINAKTGEIYVLCGDYISIGRSASCDIRFTDAGVSRSHAALKKYREGWGVVDTASKSGTLLNGKTIGKPQLLFEGDIIDVCGNRLRYTNDYKNK